MKLFATSPRRHSNEDVSSCERQSPPMEMSRRGFLMTSLASIALFPNPLLAASSPLEVSDTLPADRDASLKRHKSTHTTHTRSSNAGSRGAASTRSHTKYDANLLEEDHKGDPRSTQKKLKLKKPADNGGKGKGTTPRPTRIKGIARTELVLKVSEALV